MLAPDTILQDRYRIIRQLGQGGMGIVYEAADARLATTVALKQCHFTEEKLRKQFEHEARLLARLRHPAMTRVIDHFSEADSQFLVMDFVGGEDLWALLEKNGEAFPPDRVLEWADQLLDVLDYLHSQQPPVVHRDIKPHNLKLSNEGQIILLDFGLAKGFAGQLSQVSTTASIFGYTPNYAPLEQIQGAGTDPRSDLYSLAATLYHLMTGQMPPDVLSRLAATSDGHSDPLLPANEVNPSVAPEVAAWLYQAMAISRNNRFASAVEMRKALRQRTGKSTSGAETTSRLSSVSPQQNVSQPSTLVGVRPAQTSAESNSTVASSPFILSVSSAPGPAIGAEQAQTQLLQSGKRSYRQTWIIGGIAALLFVGVVIVVIAWRKPTDSARRIETIKTVPNSHPEKASPSPEQNSQQDRANGLRRQLQEAENDRKNLQTAYEAARNATNVLTVPEVRDNQEIREKLKRKEALEYRRAQLLTVYTEQYPEIRKVDAELRALEQEINDVAQKIIAAMKTRYEQALARENALRQALNQQTNGNK